MKRIVLIFLVLSTLSTKAQLKDSTVTGIYTDYKTYWATSTASNSSIRPDSSHNLLGFTFRGKTYSTGVNDATLNTKLGSGNYSAQVFKALPIKNIAGTVVVGGATNLAFALKDDGDSTKAAYSSPYPTIHIADVLMDGKNGLDLGTGVTNLPKGGHISFPIKNLDPKRATDAIPDLVFTQIAEPTTNQPDTIFFFDDNNNIVGNKKLVYWNTVNKLGTYKLDLYTLTPKALCNTSIMNGLFEQNGTRDIRMVAFLMTEFGITSNLAAQVKGIQINPSGSSDQAFIAYNANTMNLDVPTFTKQPATQMLCSPSVTSATFSVSATSTTEITYQWKKNGEAILNATASSYTATDLTWADTDNVYSVTVSNSVGSITSNNAYLKYIILTQPSPATQTLATGNAAFFAEIKTSGATSLQWQKDGSPISGATSPGYSLSVVNSADSGKYTVLVSYNGGTCTSDTALLKTSIILYSKATGNLNQPATWGVAEDGSGSSPVDFTRREHTFIVANRQTAATGGDITIAGTLDIANGNMIVLPNTTLQANKITRSLSSGTISVSPTSSLIVGYGSSSAGQSDLYFDPNNNTLKNLTIAAKTVVLHNALNLVSGKNYGILQVNYGTFNTSDSLTLKSDSLGTAGVAKSAGSIIGKVTIEKYIHARRAWRFIGAPIANINAPTIHDAWQEGAASSTANPNPGYGTHITGGTEANGFDRSPTNNPSLQYITATGAWAGLSNTNKTPITQYPAYMFFIRGNRSYNILSTTTQTTPSATVIRVTGNLYQGNIASKTVSANGYTVVVNPYASPINFAKAINASSNVKKRIYVWDPTLAGTKGVGAWVVVDGTTGTYKTTPPSTYISNVLQAGQGFLIESADGASNGNLAITEDDKDFTAATINGDKVVNTRDTSLEVNFKVFNSDSSTSITDGILYNFYSSSSDSFDVNDASKMYNASENLSVPVGNHVLSINSRTAPNEGDSLRLTMGGIKATNYQFEFVPSSLSNKSFALYDKYLNTVSPISATDTTHVTFTVLSTVAASKAANRFTIVVLKSKVIAALPPAAAPFMFTTVRTNTKDNAISVEWKVQNEANVLYYQVQQSTDGSNYTAAGSVAASAKGTYTFVDASPAAGINYYRIKSIGKDGSITYAPVVTGQLDFTTPSAVSVYPNPLTGATFTLTLKDLAAGSYILTVVNANGTTLFTKSIAHPGGTASQKVNLHNSLAAGVYYINISTATKTISTVTVSAN